MYRVCLGGNSTKKEIYNTRMNKYVHTYMPTHLHLYLHTYIHTYIPTYKHTKSYNPYKSYKPYAILHTLPYKPYTTLHIQTTHTCAMKIKKMIVFNNEASFRGKGYIGPPRLRITGRSP